MTAQRILSLLTAIFLFFGLTAASHATLIDNEDGTVTDDTTNLMWLQNANLAGTTMTWDAAMAWADGLSYAGYDDWRLPTTPGTAEGYLNDGEMGHLYYDEGVTDLTPSPFTNVPPLVGGDVHWTGTADEWRTSGVVDAAWYFHFTDGHQGHSAQDYSPGHYAWAVRDMAAVPEPASLLLLGSGLVGMVGLRKLRK